jgi:hypothetical protein
VVNIDLIPALDDLVNLTVRLVDMAVLKLKAKDQEIEVLTQERDNALLRIEELEGQIEYWRNYRPWSEPGVADYYRGGVNPNA